MMMGDGSEIVAFAGGRYRVWRGGKRWVVLLHGRGGGMESCHLTVEELFPLRDLFAARGVTVVAPEYGSDCWMNPKAEAFVLSVMDEVTKREGVEGRPGLMGVSMGGGGALVLMAHHPEKFVSVCAVMPVTDFVRFYEGRPQYQESISAAYGGSPVEQASLYRDRSVVSHAGVLRGVRVLLIHGAMDSLVTPDYSRVLYEMIETGGNARLIEVAGCGHENRILAGLEEEVVGWLGK